MAYKENKLVTKWLDENEEKLIQEATYCYGDNGLLKCESPIEEVMYLALVNLFQYFSIFQARYFVEITTQRVIETGSRTYRTDISVEVHDLKTLNLDTDQYRVFKFAVECDGHEFHEKTKEQVRNDRKRERFLMKNGYTVIRFAGSEIYDDAQKCALEVWEIIKKRIDSPA